MHTVGELSNLTNVAIRTLHYYEKIGLLNPIRKEANPYRLFGEQDFEDPTNCDFKKNEI